jgi:phage portal protein BeeE
MIPWVKVLDFSFPFEQKKTRDQQMQHLWTLDIDRELQVNKARNCQNNFRSMDVCTYLCISIVTSILLISSRDRFESSAAYAGMTCSTNRRVASRTLSLHSLASGQSKENKDSASPLSGCYLDIGSVSCQMWLVS